MGGAAHENSPVLVTSSGNEAAKLLAAAWACDGLVVLYASASGEQMIEHIRSCMRGKPDRVVGWCWPSVARQLLEHGSRESVQAFMRPLSAVLLEADEEGQEWIVFTKNSLDDHLESQGIHLIADTQPTEPQAPAS
jgi:hypothetical protein